MTILQSIKALFGGDEKSHDHDHDHHHDQAAEVSFGSPGPGLLMDRGDGELAGLHDHEADQVHPHQLGEPNSTIETDVRPSSAD